MFVETKDWGELRYDLPWPETWTALASNGTLNSWEWVLTVFTFLLYGSRIVLGLFLHISYKDQLSAVMSAFLLLANSVLQFSLALLGTTGESRQSQQWHRTTSYFLSLLYYSKNIISFYWDNQTISCLLDAWWLQVAHGSSCLRTPTLNRSKQACNLILD